MGILDELLGGQRQKEYQDFVNRYEQGSPSEGYSDQEVLKRYSDVSHAVPPNQYAKAAIEALGKLSPEDRAAFMKMLQERAAARGVAMPRNSRPNRRNWAKCSPICIRSRVSSGISLAVVTPSLRSKRNGRARLATYWRPRGQGRARGHRGHGC